MNLVKKFLGTKKNMAAYLWKCSRIRSSLTLSGRLPTQRCRVSLTILHKTAEYPHYNLCVWSVSWAFQFIKFSVSLN
jgi:hypothetical protein